MELVTPSARYKDSFLLAMEEFRRDERIDSVAKEIDQIGFDQYLVNLKMYADGRGLPESYVPFNEFWLIDNQEYIGRVSIRHRLNENLLRIGGHIGYAIRPTKRKMGYGTAILALALAKARTMGFDRVLLTCDKTNFGSAKIIQKNGGVLENEVEQGQSKPLKQRYWIAVGGKT